MSVLLISTYDMGRQPFGLASPAAWLRERGVAVRCLDAAKEPLREEAVRGVRLVAFHLPMHTATRLAGAAIARVREWNPSAHLCCYGLYAPLNDKWLRDLGVHSVLGAEFEEDLAQLATALEHGDVPPAPAGLDQRRPLRFRVPDRAGLPSLTAYASLNFAPGERRTVGYTEASRGCKHLCRHCPIVPVYNGRFRIVQPEIVLSDVRAQVAAGAQHITFGDPDFFNGIGHAIPLVEAFHREFPQVTYNVTIKVEHLLAHAGHLRTLRETGCLFVTSAVESVDDQILQRLDKGHTRADFERVATLFREAGLTLSPTFLPFTPWTTVEGYCDLLATLDRLELIDHVAPIQLAIRLLIPEGSRLLELPGVRALVDPFDAETLAYPWRHPDPRVDDLQRDVARIVGVRLNAPRYDTFHRIARLAFESAGLPGITPRHAAISRAAVPYLNEPWYC